MRSQLAHGCGQECPRSGSRHVGSSSHTNSCFTASIRCGRNNAFISASAADTFSNGNMISFSCMFHFRTRTGARTFLSASRAGARTVADKNVRAPRTDAGKNARAPLNIATAARALLLSTLIRLSFSHIRSAGRLRSSLARDACSAAQLLSSLTWGQDGTEPKVVVPVGRVVDVAERRPAVERDEVPTAAPKHPVRARRRTTWIGLQTTRV